LPTITPLATAVAEAGEVGLVEAVPGFGGGTGRFVFVRNNDLWTANHDGSGAEAIFVSPFTEAAPAWSPDGRKIAFRSNQEGAVGAGGFPLEIYLMNADGSQIERLTFDNFDDSNPTWSPDGRYIAYRSARDSKREQGVIVDNDEIYVIDLQNRDQAPRNLTNHPDDDFTPKWSHTGEFIVFSSQRDGNAFQIFRMAPDGSNVIQLTDNGYNSYTPSISATGDEVAFSSALSRDGGSGIFLVNSRGGTARTLFRDGRRNLHPSFSPDGQWLLFTSQPATAASKEARYITLISINGSLTSQVVEGEQPAWQPLVRLTQAEATEQAKRRG
jgi:Tol biopolymer transport system component